MKTDQMLLQGKWRFAAMNVEGMILPGAMFADAHMLIEGESFATFSREAVYKGTFSLGDASETRTIDLQFTDGPETGKFSLGIYTLDGDTWMVCLGFAGRDRPRGFISTGGSGHVLETLQRMK